jgi:hypothetical protein
MRIKINRPNKAVNSEILFDETGFWLFCIEDEFFLQGDATEEELRAAFAAHNPTPPTETTVAEKLASVGLSVTDLKAALGI